MKCDKCGTDTQSMAYHVCRPQMTEERVREIASSEAFAAIATDQESRWGFQENRMRSIADEQIATHHSASFKRLLSESENVKRARDEALDSAIEAIDSDGMATVIHDRLRMKIRKLKSANAPDLDDDRSFKLAEPYGPSTHVDLLAHKLKSEQPKPLVVASGDVYRSMEHVLKSWEAQPQSVLEKGEANLYIRQIERLEDDRSFMLKEHAALREKLASADAALDEIARLVPGHQMGNIAHFFSDVCVVLQRRSKEQR